MSRLSHYPSPTHKGSTGGSSADSLQNLVDRVGSLQEAAEANEFGRELLTALDLGGGMLRVPPNFGSGLGEVVAAARRGKLEGVIAKRLDAPYSPGRRSPDWIKAPFIRTQEVLIIGARAGEGRRAGTIGSLLVAVHDRASGDLSFAGGVGTGFTDAMLHDLQTRLTPLHRDTPPVTDVPRSFARGVQWTEPTVVGEVEYRSWTDDGRLRHSSWRGLRPDRRPEEVVADRAP